MLIETNGRPKVHTVQERFRDKSYSRYGDFTIRYTRSKNAHADRRKSEFFKIEAEYFVYGIVNTSKKNVDQATGFLKFAVIDMNRFREKIDKGLIYVDTESVGESKIVGDRLRAGYHVNSDGSSEFVTFEICQLVKLFGAEIVLMQEGFYKEEKA